MSGPQHALIGALIGVAMLTAPPSIAADDAAAPTELSLQQAQQMALRNHPDVVVAGLDVDAARELVNVAKSSLLPRIDGSGVRAFAHQDTRIGSTGGLTDPTILDRGSMGASLSQLITDFGRTDSLVEASKQTLKAQVARGEATQQTVLLAVTQAYFDLLRSQALLKVANGTLAQRQALADQIKSLEAAQLRSNLDVSIAEQDLDDAKQLLLTADNRAADAAAALSETLGLDRAQPFKLTDISAVPAMNQALDTALSTAANQNPDLRSLAATRDAARADAKAAEKEFYPTITALGYAGDNVYRDPYQKIMPAYATAGVVFSIPLFTGGGIEAQEREAHDRADAAQLRLEAERNRLMRDVQVAYDRLRTAYSNIDVTARQVKNADDTQRLTQARYEIGSSSIVDLSTAQLRKTQADLSHTDAIYEYLIGRATLSYVTGTLTPSGIP